MNYAQLGQRVKAKYPQYANLSDEELGKRTAAKYPQYDAQIDKGNAITNFLPSLAKNAVDTVKGLSTAFQPSSGQFIATPTNNKLTESVSNLALGGVEKLIPGQQPHEPYADAVGSFYKGRYGGVENIKRTVNTDPVGVALDLSTILTGGGSIGPKVAGKSALVQKASNIATKTGNVLDPVNDILSLTSKAVGKTGRVTAPFAKSVDTDVTKLSNEMGVDLPLSARTNSNVLKTGEAWAQKGIFGGKIRKTITDAQKRLDDLADEITIQVAGDADLKGTGTAIQKGFDDFKTTFREQKTQLYDAVSDQVMRTQASTERTLAALDEIIEQKSQSLTGGQNTAFYKSLRDKIAGADTPLSQGTPGSSTLTDSPRSSGSQLAEAGMPQAKNTMTGKQVADWWRKQGVDIGEVDQVKMLENDPNPFRLRDVKVKDLVNNDPDLKRFVETYKGGARGGVAWQGGKSPDKPIIVDSDGMQDGYHRVADVYKRNPEGTVKAYISDGYRVAQERLTDIETLYRGKRSDGSRLAKDPIGRYYASDEAVARKYGDQVESIQLPKKEILDLSDSKTLGDFLNKLGYKPSSKTIKLGDNLTYSLDAPIKDVPEYLIVERLMKDNPQLASQILGNGYKAVRFSEVVSEGGKAVRKPTTVVLNNDIIDTGGGRFMKTLAHDQNVGSSPTLRPKPHVAQQQIGDTPATTINQLKATRTEIGARLKSNDPIVTGDRATMNKLYAALSDDLDTSIKTADPAAGAALDEANTYYRTNIEKINSQLGRKIQNSDPEKLMEAIVKPNSETTVDSLREIIGEDAFGQVQESFFQRLFEKSINPKTNQVDLAKLKTQLDRYGKPTINKVLSTEQRSRLDEITTQMEKHERLQKALRSGTRAADGSQTAFLGEVGGMIGMALYNPVLLAKYLVGRFGVTQLFGTQRGQQLLLQGVDFGTPAAQGLEQMRRAEGVARPARVIEQTNQRRDQFEPLRRAQRNMEEESRRQPRRLP